MGPSLQRLTTPHLIAVATAGTALTAGIASWRWDPSATHSLLHPLTLSVAGGLFAAVVLSYRFPIHVHHSTKVYVNSVPLYLIAVLLAPPLALAVAGISQFAGEASVRSCRGTPVYYLATQAGRWAIVALVGSIVAHLTVSVIFHPITFVGTAVVLLGGDFVTSPLVLAPVTHERPWRIIANVVKEGGVGEGCQYLVGVLGAVGAIHEIWALALLALPMVLTYRSFKQAKEMHDSTRVLLEHMADTVDLRDPYTGGHSRRVTELCANTVRSLELSGPDVELIIASARVHDIGKIGVPDGVLNKPGALTDEERRVMESHSERGAELLSRYPDFSRGVRIVRHHHERWDGTGYPDRLKGTDIPFGARVIAVADSFDAMTSDRPYRKGMSIQVAAGILQEGRGKQWDARIVDAFLLSVHR